MNNKRVLICLMAVLSLLLALFRLCAYQEIPQRKLCRLWSSGSPRQRRTVRRSTRRRCFYVCPALPTAS